MIKPDLLQCFIAAADTGSFTAAGKRVGKHLATVSGNIARLEDELGCCCSTEMANTRN